MTKKNCIKPVAAVVGAALAGSLSAVNLANATENPFGATQLQSGYMVVASSKEGGEGKCGGETKEGESKEMKEGKCGEGKCGEGKEMKEGKCGGEMKEGEGKEIKEGKCGEGKCGGK